MNKNILKKIACFLCIIAIFFCMAGCAGKGGQKSLSLENGWYADSSENIENPSAGFTNDSPKEIGALVSMGDTCFSNTFEGSLDAGSNDKILLSMFDSCNISGLWLNGKELEIADVIDVTSAFKKDGENVLCAQGAGECVAPGSKIVFSVHPEVMITGVSGQIDGENVNVTVFVNNFASKAQKAELNLKITAMDNDAVAFEKKEDASFEPGEGSFTVTYHLPDCKEWSYASPFVYAADVTVSGSFGTDSFSDYMGFKSIERDENGFYVINGEQTLIKCAEISYAEAMGENLLETLNFAKTCGFNAVKVADGEPTEAMLDYCDLIGVMADTDKVNHVSAFDLADADITVEAANGRSADAAAEIAKTKAGNIVRIAASPLTEYEADTESLVKWYEEAGVNGAFAVGDAMNASGLQDVKELAYLSTLVRKNDVACIIMGGDISSKKYLYSDIIPDQLNDLRFSVTTDKAVYYNNESMYLDIVLSNFNVLRKGTFSAQINIVGENGRVYENTPSFEFAKGQHIGKVFSGSVPLTDLPEGEYRITCEYLSGGHPTCGDITFSVVSADSMPKSASVVYGAGLNAAQVKTLTDSGITVSNFTGSESGTIIVGAEAGEDIAAKAMEKAKSGSYAIILSAQTCSALPEGMEIVKPNGVFMTGGKLSKGFAQKNSMLTLCECGDIVTDCAISGVKAEESAVKGFAVSADGTVTDLDLCAVYAEGSGKVALSTLNFGANQPFTDRLLLNLVSYK